MAQPPHHDVRWSSAAEQGVRLRPARPDDGAGIWSLVEAIEGLSLNSPYAYLLVGWHFSPTSCVAEVNGVIAGFVSGYRPPVRPEVLFVWQVGVELSMRGRGLGKQMILDVLARDACEGVRWIESTVDASNVASQRMFHALARRLQAEIEVADAPGHLSSEELTNQKLIRIGPL